MGRKANRKRGRPPKKKELQEPEAVDVDKFDYSDKAKDKLVKNEGTLRWSVIKIDEVIDEDKCVVSEDNFYKKTIEIQQTDNYSDNVKE